MKNLYPKGKGQVHPTPPSPPTPSLLNRLPPEIRSLVSTQLPPEDLEILSYLIKTNQPTTSNSCTTKSQRFDCSCFHCYTAFWTRWDSSPNRNLIHQALDAFEQQQQTHPPRKRNRRVSADKKKKTTQKSHASDASRDVRIEQFSTSDDGFEEEVAKKADASDAPEGGVIFPQKTTEGSKQQQLQQEDLVRKVWPDVLGFFNSRLWSLWSPNI